MTLNVEDAVLAVLDVHRRKTMGVRTVECECGVVVESDADPETTDEASRRHVTLEILAALIAGPGVSFEAAVDAFKAAWHEADKAGLDGGRVAAGLTAVFALQPDRCAPSKEDVEEALLDASCVAGAVGRNRLREMTGAVWGLYRDWPGVVAFTTRAEAHADALDEAATALWRETQQGGVPHGSAAADWLFDWLTQRAEELRGESRG